MTSSHVAVLCISPGLDRHTIVSLQTFEKWTDGCRNTRTESGIECEIKDNGIRARNEFLTANNHKLQVEHMRNKMLDVENERLQEENKKLELEKESLVEEGNNKVSAMGQDMGNLIHKNKILRRKYKKKMWREYDRC